MLFEFLKRLSVEIKIDGFFFIRSVDNFYLSIIVLDSIRYFSFYHWIKKKKNEGWHVSDIR